MGFLKVLGLGTQENCNDSTQRIQKRNRMEDNHGFNTGHKVWCSACGAVQRGTTDSILLDNIVASILLSW